MFLFDTYAIIEIIKGNKNYERYLDSEFIINDFIITELSYWIIKEHGVELLDRYVDKYKKFVKRIETETIKKAMEFRYRNKNKKLSTTDCVSYIQAKELGIKFLTGDKEFEKLDGVEFVK